MAYEGIGTALQLLTSDSAGSLPNFQTPTFYAQGTFIPTITFSGSAVGVTYSVQKGQYTRYGNTVFYSIQLTLTNKGSSTGMLLINGLPYPNGTTTVPLGALNDWQNFNIKAGYKVITFAPFPSSSGIELDMCGVNGTNVTVDNTFMTN